MTAFVVLIALGSSCTRAKNPDGGLPTGSCAEDQIVIGRDLRRIYASDGRAAPCASHADCDLLDIDIPCQSSCPAAVLTTQASELRAQIVSYGQRACPLAECASSGNCVGYERAVCTDAGFCARGFLDGGVTE